MIKTKSTIETYNTLCNRLDNNSKVYYTRFGDGDFYIMNGRSESFHDYNKKLSSELVDSFNIRDKNYLVSTILNHPNEVGMYDGVFKRFQYNDNLVRMILNNVNIHIDSDSVFENAIMPHYISVFHQDLMIKFLNKYIRPKSKVFIGSIPKKSIEALIGSVDYYINVPSKNAYDVIDEWWPLILNVIDNVDICIPAAGISTRIIQKRLWELNKNIHSIDIGSVVDAVDGNLTRTWIKKEGHKIKNILIE